MNRSISSRMRPTIVIFVILAFSIVLGGCETTAFDQYTGGQSEQNAEQLASAGRHADAAAEYIGMASESYGDERVRLTLLAVEQWLDAGDGKRARNALTSTPQPGDGELLYLWTADMAALALWEGRPDDALSLLEPMDKQPLSREMRARTEALRGDAWFQKDDPLLAVEIFMRRESYLQGVAEIERGRQRLWAGLLVSDVSSLRTAEQEATDPVAQGWLGLGALAVSTGQQGIGWTSGATRWRDSHLGHPAAMLVTDMELPVQAVLSYPRRIALMLPLSGKNAGVGNAVKNGFLGAYFSTSAGLEDEQQILIYDTGAGDGVLATYQRALDDGAEFVVGPLVKKNVTTLTELVSLPVPVLALNYLPDNFTVPPGLFQFALSPEDEAASAAARALADGHQRAVALYPNNAWGRRVVSSFLTEFEGGGGILLDNRSFTMSNQDFSPEIEGLMSLTDSIARSRRLQANIGAPIQFEPRRRQDVEFVFLAANASAGRLIKSQLKFHYSGELPVYSTSFIYSMDGRSNTDLNGVMFADAPWIIEPPAWIAEFPDIYDEYWPSERRLGRLHAMGYDAYHLVAGLFSSGGGDLRDMPGATGNLYMGNGGRIHRNLVWAQFMNGQPVPLPGAPEPDLLLEDLPDEAGNEQGAAWPDQAPQQ